MEKPIENKGTPEKSLAVIGVVGLILNGIFLLGILPVFNFFVFLLILFPVIGVFPLSIPIVSITLGICGIAKHFEKNNQNKKIRYLVINIINVAVPLITIITFMVLLSTGVLVIRFM